MRDEPVDHDSAASPNGHAALGRGAEKTAAGRERADVVIVGARCAGTAAAIPLAHAGRRVIAIDRATFPSDTLSTHVNFPSALAEIQRLGGLARMLASQPPLCRDVLLEADGVQCFNRFAPIDGIDYGTCVPRPQLDLALVETARAAGAEVREQTGLVDVRFDGDRATGVVVEGPEGRYEIDCKLVIGADGRRSTIAAKVGAARPYRGSRNGRGLAFFYMDDPLADTEWGTRMIQLRLRDTHTLIFPCPDERMLVLFMGPAEEIPQWRGDPDGMWDRMLAENPRIAFRVEGATNRTKCRSTGDTVSFFRRSSGPGWALTGDAGHFKDPVIAQGIRDAVRFARLLGEAVAPVIDDPTRCDRALLAVEARRDRECLATYHWANRESRIIHPSPLLKEALRDLNHADPPLLTHMFDRVQAPDRVLNPARAVRWAARAALRPGTDRRALARELVEEARIDLDIHRERLAGRFRSTRLTASERPDYVWPPRQPGRAGATPAPARQGAPSASEVPARMPGAAG